GGGVVGQGRGRPQVALRPVGQEAFGRGSGRRAARGARGKAGDGDGRDDDGGGEKGAPSDRGRGGRVGPHGTRRRGVSSPVGRGCRSSSTASAPSSGCWRWPCGPSSRTARRSRGSSARRCERS